MDSHPENRRKSGTLLSEHDIVRLLEQRLQKLNEQPVQCYLNTSEQEIQRRLLKLCGPVNKKTKKNIEI
jgi:hypothetical protein